MTQNVTVHIGAPEDMGRRFVDAWKRAEQGQAVDESHRTFVDMASLLAALTPKRWELLRYVRHHRVASVKALAADLHRNYKNVHSDVEALARLGLLAKTPAGVEAPFAEVEARMVL